MSDNMFGEFLASHSSAFQWVKDIQSSGSLKDLERCFQYLERFSRECQDYPFFSFHALREGKGVTDATRYVLARYKELLGNVKNAASVIEILKRTIMTPVLYGLVADRLGQIVVSDLSKVSTFAELQKLYINTYASHHRAEEIFVNTVKFRNDNFHFLPDTHETVGH